MCRGLTFSAIVMVLTIGVVAPARADIIVQESGGTNPNSLGFTSNVGLTAPGFSAGGAWNISGVWCCDYDQYVLTVANLADISSAPGWTYTATFSNLSPDTSPTEGGSYADLIVDDIRFDFNLHSDGLGDQVLSLDDFTGSPSYTISNLGTNPVTLSLVYDNTTDLGAAYVNGTEVISGFAGYAYSGYPSIVVFGGEDGSFTNVELSTNSVSAVPEPGSALLLLSVVGLLGRRLARPFSTSV